MARFFNIPPIVRQALPMRMVACIAFGLAFLLTWSIYGANILATLNPKLGQELALAERPALDVWITPPEYAKAPLMIISTPAGVRFEHDTLTIPQGSVISAHLAEQEGSTPQLIIDGKNQEFDIDTHGDFAATADLMEGKKISIRRGWTTLASWKVHIIADTPPEVELTEPPVIGDNKSLRLSYNAFDAFGISDVVLRVTPGDPAPGADNDSVDIPLPAAPAKQISRVDFEDLAMRPWAGQKVTLQIIATNDFGRKGYSTTADIVLPERHFFHPIARVLIEERKKLMQSPDDEMLREQTANIMAGIAHETNNYHGDPLVLMALRSGAVRLILNHDHAAAISVNNILWDTATRIEDGNAGAAERTLRDARQDLATH